MSVWIYLALAAATLVLFVVLCVVVLAIWSMREPDSYWGD